MELSGTERWRQETAPANLRLVRERASFRSNVLRLVDLYARCLQ